MSAPYVDLNPGGLTGSSGLQQDTPQPRRIAALEIESFPEYPSLVTPARMCRAEAIVLDLANIEYGLIGVRQIGHHGTVGPSPPYSAAGERTMLGGGL